MLLKIYTVKILLLLSSFLIYGQSGWQNWETIYDKDGIKVELAFYLPKTNSCNGGKKFKFKYRVTGQYLPSPRFLNWKMDYIDCNGNLYEQKNSLEIGKNLFEDITNGISIENFDDRFVASSLETKFYKVVNSNRREVGTKLKAFPLSKDPKGIIGPNMIYLGQPLQLSVEGGRLGIGAEWIWYENNCQGKEIGRGKSIIMRPTQNVTYFVRAVGQNNQTICVQKRVVVDKRSTAPSAVIGEKKICQGSQTRLSVKGGSLGEGANWIWYTGDCGGKSIGQGINIVVTPQQTTRYYVRAEGILNTTSCESIEVGVFEKSEGATSIKIRGDNRICEGESVTLHVNGGFLASDAKWRWYRNNCGGYAIGDGSQITVQPTKNTTYFVRAEGACNNSACIQVNVQVDRKSRLPSSIVTSNPNIKKGEEVTLSILGGELALGSKWQWFKGKCNGVSIGHGQSVMVKPRSKTNYFVKATGNCQSPNCTNLVIDPLKRHNWSSVYTSPKFLHFGLGVGLEYFEFSTLAKFTNSNINPYQDSIEVTGIGIKGNATFHPVLNKWLHLGGSIAFALGTTPNWLNTNPTVDESYFYSKYTIGGEMAIGLAPIKLLTVGQKTIINNDLSRVGEAGENILLQGNLGTENLAFGLRLGRMNSKSRKRRKGIWDVMIQFSRTNIEGFSLFGSELVPLTDWNKGIQVNIWKPSSYRFEFSLTLMNSGESLTFDNDSFENAFFQIGLFYNRNWFY